MSSSATGSDAGLLASTSVLSGADWVTTKCSGIEFEIPGLQGAVSRCSFGSIISHGTDSKGFLLRRFEIWTINDDFNRFNLTELVEVWEDVKEEYGFCFDIPPPIMIQFRDLFERGWGWERFVPAYNPRYLEEFYWRNVKASGAQSETTLSRQPTIFATPGLNLAYLGRKKVTGFLQSDATTGQQHATCSDHNLSDATTGLHHANSSCGNHNLACADHNLAIADHNLAIILVHLCCEKESELVSEWKKQRLQYRQKKQKKKKKKKILLKKQNKTKGFELVSRCKRLRLQYWLKRLQQLKKGSQKKQNKMKESFLLFPEIRLSTRIQKKIISLVQDIEKKPTHIIRPVIYDCINCIMKEAELILEWLRLGFGPYSFDHDLSHNIRKMGITKESEIVCKKLRQDDDILSAENTMSSDIRTSALNMLAYGMDDYVLKRARIDGFCYRVHFDPASVDTLSWYEKERQHSKAQDTELGKVHVDELIKENHATKNKLEKDVAVNDKTRDSHESIKENHSTKNKLEEGVTVSGLTSDSHELSKEKHSTKKAEDVILYNETRGAWSEGLYPERTD